MINNLINGNLTDARKQAKRFSEARIRLYLIDELGWGDIKAIAAACYLKTGEGFQDYCNAV